MTEVASKAPMVRKRYAEDQFLTPPVEAGANMETPIEESGVMREEPIDDTIPDRPNAHVQTPTVQEPNIPTANVQARDSFKTPTVQAVSSF